MLYMNNTKVSIIIPIYNAEKTIRRCIESVLQQNYTNFELLLINDGSKDNSKKICYEYLAKDNRIKLHNKENGGVSTARNLGIKNATGEWITFIDADDWVEPNFLDSVNNIIDNRIDWIFAEWRTVWNDILLNEINEYEESIVLDTKQSIDEMWNRKANLDIFRCPWGKFFKSSVVKNNNLFFDQDLRYGEDTVFNYEYLSLCNCIKLSKKENANYVFYQVKGTIAVNKYKCTAESIISARDKVFSIYFSRGYHNNKLERLFFFAFTMIERIYLTTNEDNTRKKYYQGSIQEELEKRCLHAIKFYDRFMYLLFKKMPHSLLKPIASIYLRYR